MPKQLEAIAHIESDFTQKFGIPRQSGVVPQLLARVVFAPPYRTPEALRGLEGFSHIWLLWGFSEAKQEGFSPTVRPPRLGGNKRLGVFATRSPFRPNGIGLSAVALAGIEEDAARGQVLLVRGADLLHGTPVYDIKPYLPFADCLPEATGGFASEAPEESLQVEAGAALLAKVPEEKRAALLAVLAHDPRPRYQEDAARVYGMAFAGFEVKFSVAGDVLRVLDIIQAE